MTSERAGRGCGALVAAGVVATLGCSRGVGATQVPGADGSVPLIEMREPLGVAERIESEVELMTLPMGTMVLDVCPEQGRLSTAITASKLVRLVRKLSGTATTHLAEGGLAPERTEVQVFDGDKTRTYRVGYAIGAFDYEYENAEHVVKSGREELGVEAPLHDLQSSMVLLRQWRPRLNESGHFYVVLGRQPWRVEARFSGQEMLTVAGTPQLTRRIDGEAARLNATADRPEQAEVADTRREFTLWFDADGPGHPVRLVARSTYGDVTMSLARYVRSDEFCAPTASAPSPQAFAEDRAPLSETP